MCILIGWMYRKPVLWCSQKIYMGSLKAWWNYSHFQPPNGRQVGVNLARVYLTTLSEKFINVPNSKLRSTNNVLTLQYLEGEIIFNFFFVNILSLWKVGANPSTKGWCQGKYWNWYQVLSFRSLQWKNICCRYPLSWWPHCVLKIYPRRHKFNSDRESNNELMHGYGTKIDPNSRSFFFKTER